MNNKKVKNIVFVLVCCLLLSGCKEQQNHEQKLLKCLSVQYWDFDLSSFNTKKKDMFLFVNVQNKDQVLFSKKIVSLLELKSTRVTVVLQRQIKDYVLYICNDKTAYATSLSQDFFYMPLLSLNQTKSLNLNDYIVKADTEIIVNEFSKLYDTETGIKLDIRSE